MLTDSLRRSQFSWPVGPERKGGYTQAQEDQELWGQLLDSGRQGLQLQPHEFRDWTHATSSNGTWESEGAGGATHGGGHEVVEVAVAGVGQLERAHADVVQRLLHNTTRRGGISN
jgi:hypothetical protein